MQGAAGNRAVAQFLQVQRCGPVSADQCACHAADDEVSTPAPDAPRVQRLSLGNLVDAAGALGSGGLATAFGRARSEVSAVESGAHTAGDAHEREVSGQLERGATVVKTHMDAADAAGRSSADQHVASTEQRAQTLAAGAEELRQQASGAGTALDAVSPLLEDLVSPVTAILEPEKVGGAGDALNEASQAATGGTGPGAIGSQTAGAARGQLGVASIAAWDCDLSGVIAGAGKVDQAFVSEAVNPGQRQAGAERLARISAFATGMRQRLGAVGSQLQSALSSVGVSAHGFFGSAGVPLLASAQGMAAWLRSGFDALRGWVDITSAKTRGDYLVGSSRTTEGGTAFVQGLARRAGSAINGAAGGLSLLLASVGKSIGLPDGFTAFTQSLPARTAATTGYLGAIGSGLATRAAALKGKALSCAKGFVNSALQFLAAARHRAQAVVNRVTASVKSALAAIGKRIGDWRDGAIRRVLARVQASAGGLQDAANRLVRTIKDSACVALGATAGPCVTQHLPDLGGGINNTVRLVARGDLILPLEEFGVPGNLKVAAGAAVAVSAKDGFYTLRVDGSAELLLNETLGSDSHVEGGTPVAATSSLAQAWAALSGGNKPPAADLRDAAAGAAATVAANGVGGGQAAQLNAGLKGRSSSEWRFDATKAATSCEGVGGLVALMSMLGVASSLPAPFNSAAPVAVYEGFKDQLQHSRFSVGIGAEVSADLKTEGIAKISGRVAADVSENLETTRDPVTGELITRRTLSLTGELDASARAKLTAGSLGALDAFLSGQGIVRLTLAYQGPPREAIVPSAVGGAIKVSIGVQNFDPARLLAAIQPFLPDAVGPIDAAIRGGLPGLDGPREVALGLTVGRTYTGLEDVSDALAKYFNGAPQDVTVDGVIAIVKEHLDKIKPVDLLKVELSQIQRKRLAVGGTVAEAGAAAGGDVDVSAEHEISRVWQNFSGADAVMDAAGARTRTVPSVVEPGKKPPWTGKRQAPTGAPDDPIQMIWYKPRGAYGRVFLGEEGKKKEFPKEGKTPLPDPDHDEHIGVDGFARVGQTIRRERKTPRGGREREFVELLDHHGFDWRGKSPDHVFDLAWGGDDDFNNMWPLDSKINADAGRMHNSHQTVVFNFFDDDVTVPPRRARLSDPRFEDGAATFRINEITVL